MCDSFLGEGEVGVCKVMQICTMRINPSLPLPFVHFTPPKGGN